MKEIKIFILDNERFRQFLRFCLVGAFATALDACLFYLFRLYFTYQVSMIVSYIISLCSNMVLTLLWSFNATINIRNTINVVIAHLFNLFVVRFGLMALFVKVLYFNDRLAYVPTLCISVLINYFIIKSVIHKPENKDNE